MKKIYSIIFMFAFTLTFQAQKLTSIIAENYKNAPTEKSYIQLNNVLYEPNEIVYFSIITTNSTIQPTDKSDFVFVEIYDASKKKVYENKVLIENGMSNGSFQLRSDLHAGLFTIKAYTKWQIESKDAFFERTFFVQKVISPRILMQLNFQKKSYGKSDEAIADFVLKNKENNPLKYHEFTLEILKDNVVIEEHKGKTDALGKAQLHYTLPNDLETKNMLYNVKISYDNQQESITKAIPIELNTIDLQFLPESGQLIANETNKLYFIAKNELGLPLDCSGEIINSDNTVVANFTTTHDGMGICDFTPKSNEQYVARLISPFIRENVAEIPIAREAVFTVQTERSQDELTLKIYAPIESKIAVVIRNSSEIIDQLNLKTTLGWNSTSVELHNYTIGIYTISVLYNDQIVAEKLVFVNPSKVATIAIKTDKEFYLPREKVAVEITTSDDTGNPVAADLSVRVIDQKLLTHVDDKQHTILSWLLLGSELKTDVYEPSYYFNPEKPLQERLAAIDLLLNTHGWRKYEQTELYNPMFAKAIIPEKNKTFSGFITNASRKNLSQTIHVYIDDGTILQTKSNKDGYFEFPNYGIEKNAFLLVKNTKKESFTIINEKNKELYNFLQKVVTNKESYTQGKSFETIQNQMIAQQNAIETIYEFSELENDSNPLNEVVVQLGYGSKTKEELTGSVRAISQTEIMKSLVGSVAGLQIVTGIGQPGSYSGKIAIRGASSLYGSRANNGILMIVDGIALNSQDSQQLLSSISPKNIQSLFILKDPTEISNYGYSNCDAVIVIQTKRNNFNYDKKQFVYAKSFIPQSYRKSNAATFYIPKYETTQTDEKTDFRNCIYWNHRIQTDENGKAKFEFYNSDATTSFAIQTEGITTQSQILQSQQNYVVSEPLEIDVKVPLYLTIEDTAKIPVWIKNNTNEPKEISIETNENAFFDVENSVQKVTLQANQAQTIYTSIVAQKFAKNTLFEVTIRSDSFYKKYKLPFQIFPKGYEKSIVISGTESQKSSFTISNLIPNTLQSKFMMYLNPITSVFDDLESMIKEPHGCFEQVSSSNYPNILALQLLESQPMESAFRNKAIDFLQKGYQKLKNYESKNGGFELYGGNPANPTLTAYGLLQFHLMKKYVSVDEIMFQRNLTWLMSQKDGKGNFSQPKGSYGVAAMETKTSNAFILYTLSEINPTVAIDTEYKKAISDVNSSEDLYQLSLLANVAFNREDTEMYTKITSKISQIIHKYDDLQDIKMHNTIVKSSYNSSLVEVLSIYTLALMKERKITAEIYEIISFIQSKKTKNGFGNTHATALALRALSQFLQLNSQKYIPKNPTILVNSELLKTLTKDSYGNIIANDLSFKPNENEFEIQIENPKPTVPYALRLQYQSYVPDNSSNATIHVQTNLMQRTAKVSDVVSVQITISNSANEVAFNPIVRIGIPGGTVPELWQLKDWTEKNIVDYYEIIGNELVLYFREFDRNQVKKLDLQLKALFPGKYQATPSSSYLYYQNEDVIWAEGLSLQIVE